MPTNNLVFIANFIFMNPGCTQVQVRRALCERNDKEYTRGYYTGYFNYRYRHYPEYPGYSARGKGYWEVRDGGLYITQKGYALLG